MGILPTQRSRRGSHRPVLRSSVLLCFAALAVSIASVVLLAGAIPGMPAGWQGIRAPSRRLESGKKRDDVLMPLLDLRPNAYVWTPSARLFDVRRRTRCHASHAAIRPLQTQAAQRHRLVL